MAATKVFEPQHIHLIAANQLRRSILCDEWATTKAKRTY